MGKVSKSKSSKSKGDKEIEVIEEDDEVGLDSNEEGDEEGEDEGKKGTKSGKMKEDDYPADIPKSARCNRKILVCHKGVESTGWENIEQISCKHPRTGNQALFFIDKRVDSAGGPFMYEMMTMEQDTRSWFVSETVLSDGNAYICTPFDPLFLILPILKKSVQAKPLRDHLTDHIGNTKFVDILCSRLISSNSLEAIAVKKVCDDIIAFKYSEEASLKWLSVKVEKTCEFLMSKDISNTEASVSINFVKSSSENKAKEKKNRDEYLRYACEIIGEYLPEELKKQIFEKFGLPITVLKSSNSSKRKSENECMKNDHSKKLKGDQLNGSSVQPLEDYGSSNTLPANAASATKGKTKDKEFQKAAKGTPSLFKFFAPKAK